MNPCHIMLVAGARPNFMKVAPIARALNARREEAAKGGVALRVSIVHTGQHYDENMSEVFFRELEIPKPDHHLEVGSGSHAEQTAKIMIAFEKVLLADRPDWVVVVGDVNSTIACALTAKKLGVKVAHVEAGLRSFDETMPEEINRKLTDCICDLLFVTEESGLRNLRAEGVADEKIHLVGNVMIDTLLTNWRRSTGGVHPSEAVRAFCDAAATAVHPAPPVERPTRRETLERSGGALGDRPQIPILFPDPRTGRKRNVRPGLRRHQDDRPERAHGLLYAVRKAAMLRPIPGAAGGVDVWRPSITIP
jgi:UDP-N-acetylglucosamine 2-epimerase (non-hydrolysing)